MHSDFPFEMVHLNAIANNLIFHKDRLALVMPGGQYLTYGQLFEKVKNLQGIFLQLNCSRIGLVIDDSADMYAAIFACWFSSKAYVPLSPEYPSERLEKIIRKAEIRFIWQNMRVLPKDFDNVILIRNENIPSLAVDGSLRYSTTLSDEAYVLFTSGTSGEPKGVPINHANLHTFVEGFSRLGYSVTAEDKFLQMFELTFDLSVMSFTIPLVYGASFYTIDKSKVKHFALYEVLDKYQISFALMVPSVVSTLAPYLEDEELPALKVTQFCGEALTVEQVKIWNKCCPNSIIDNVYGPTEATIYCSRYTAVPTQDLLHKNGIVCIGAPLSGTIFEINEDELCIGGGQVTSGYLQATTEMENKFYLNDDEWFYKSGDVAVEENNLYFCLGRRDSQVKIQGHRIELSEIEYAYEQALRNGRGIVITTNQNNMDHLALFILDEQYQVPDDLVKSRLSEYLPDYMIPHYIVRVAEFPLNANGKIDRKKLGEWLT